MAELLQLQPVADRKCFRYSSLATQHLISPLSLPLSEEKAPENWKISAVKGHSLVTWEMLPAYRISCAGWDQLWGMASTSLEQGFIYLAPCLFKNKHGLFRLQAGGDFDHWKSPRLSSMVSSYRQGYASGLTFSIKTKEISEGSSTTASSNSEHFTFCSECCLLMLTVLLGLAFNKLWPGFQPFKAGFKIMRSHMSNKFGVLFLYHLLWFSVLGSFLV